MDGASARMRAGAARLARPALAAAALAIGLPSLARAAEGMPQLNFANPLTTGQAIWMLVIFFVLYVMVRDHGLPRVAAVVEARNASIMADLDAARHAKAEADQAVAEQTVVTRRAQAEAQASIAAAIEQAKREAAAQAEIANARLDAQLQEAEARIHAARQSAMDALQQVSADTAQALVTRLLGTTPDRGAIDSAVSRVIAARAA